MRSILALLIASACVFAPGGAAMAGPPPDVCQTCIAENAQIERDTDLAVRMLRDGQSNFTSTWHKYLDNVKRAANCPSDHKTCDLLMQTIMTAMYCKDPDDVKILTNPEDLKPGKTWIFHIDEWRVNTNIVYEGTKNHSLSPATIKVVDDALRDQIEASDRQKAASQFNARAQEGNQPMQLIVDQKDDQLHLRAR